MNYHLSPVSKNAKTGPIAVSTSNKDTCPDNCGLKANGCYAESGHVNIHWQAVSTGKRGVNYEDFLLQVKALPNGKLFRHNQAGDLSGAFNKLNAEDCLALAHASKRVIGFTYTHYPVLENSNRHIHNRLVIKQMNELGFTVNLSADNLEIADQMKSLDIAPVVTILPINAGKVTITPQGNKVVTCPATYRDDINCDTCRICANASSKRSIIGFPAHGISKKKAEKVFNIKAV